MRMKEPDHGLDGIKKRIDAIIAQRPCHEEILEFLKRVMTEQYKIRAKVKTLPLKIDEEKIRGLSEGFSLMRRKDLSLDIASVAELFERLCTILSHRGKVSRDVKRINQAMCSKRLNLLELFKDGDAGNNESISALSKKLRVKKDLLLYLTRNSIKPVFEAYANDLKGHVEQEMWWRGYCPICGSEPLMAELREEGEKFLVCSLCGFEWRFIRLKCPFCENEDHQGLRYFYTEKEGKVNRVEVCEKCKKYIKVVDTRELSGEVVPLVEDVATLHLDALAQKEGYTRGGVVYPGQ